MGVHRVHPCQTKMPLQGLVDGWIRIFSQYDVGGNSGGSSHVPVGQESVRAQYGSLLDAILHGFSIEDTLNVCA